MESCTAKGLGLDSTEVFGCPPSLTRDVRSFFSCSWQTNPPLLFLACFKSLIEIRRIQVKITWVTQQHDTLTGNVFLQCKENLEPEILSWPLHSYMSHPKRKEKCRQLLFPFCYHNEHGSVETQTPKICTACIPQISNTCSKQFYVGDIQTSSSPQGK